MQSIGIANCMNVYDFLISRLWAEIKSDKFVFVYLKVRTFTHGEDDLSVVGLLDIFRVDGVSIDLNVKD